MFENDAECNRCGILSDDEKPCSWHRSIFQSYNNDRCFRCKAKFLYNEKAIGLHSKVWKIDRDSYKKLVIHDFACPSGFIPEHITKILTTDTQRLMFKHTKRLLLDIVDSRGYDNSHMTVAKCMYDLYHIHEHLSQNKFRRRESILEELDTILYHACEIEYEYYGCSMGVMMSHLDEISDMTKNVDITHISGLEELIMLHDTEEIASDDDNEWEHIRNIRKGFCSCTTYTEHNTCKHISDVDPNDIKVQEPDGAEFIVNMTWNKCSCTGNKKWSHCWHINKARKIDTGQPDTSVTVKGSNGKIYYVEDGFCTCLGFRHHSKCKHVEKVVKKANKYKQV